MSEPLTENIIQTVRSAIQDFVAPSVRELSVRMESLEKRNEEQYRSIRDNQDSQFRALMSAIGEARAKSDLETFKLISALTERVAALEAAHR